MHNQQTVYYKKVHLLLFKKNKLGISLFFHFTSDLLSTTLHVHMSYVSPLIRLHFLVNTHFSVVFFILSNQEKASLVKQY